MGQPEPVFLLVKSLDTREKKLIKQFSDQRNDQETKGYLKLFDAIARQKEYNEAKLKSKFREEGFVRNFSLAKNYLINLILKVLRRHLETPEASMDFEIQDLKILVDKRIYSLARKRLKKCYQRATEEERFDNLLKLLQIEQELIYEEQEETMNKFRERVVDIGKRTQEARKLRNNLEDYQSLFFTHHAVAKRYRTARGELGAALLEGLATDALMEDASRALSRRAQRMYYKAWYMVYVFQGKFDQAFGIASQSVTLYEENPFLIHDHIQDYVKELQFLSAGNIQAGRFEEGLHYLEKLAQVKTPYRDLKVEIFDKYFLGLINYSVETESPDLVLEKLDVITEGLEKYRLFLPLSRLYTFWFFLGRLMLIAGRYSEAKSWLEAIINTPQKGIREDLQSMARVLMIIVHFEMGDFELVEYSSRATRKYLRRREQLHKFESRLLRFLENDSAHVEQSGLVKAFIRLRADLEEIFKDQYELPVLQLFDVINWLERKINSDSV